MLALHSRTEISLLQKRTEKLTNPLSGGYQNLSPQRRGPIHTARAFPKRSFVDRRVSFPFKCVQQRIESPGTELVPVPGELLDEP